MVNVRRSISSRLAEVVRHLILTCTQPCWVLDLSAFDLRVQGRHGLIVEWHFATDQHVENDAKAPHVDFGPSVDFGVQQLWRSKIQRPAEGGKVRMGRVQIRQAEVDNLDVSSFTDENVLDFQVYKGDNQSVSA